MSLPVRLGLHLAVLAVLMLVPVVFRQQAFLLALFVKMYLGITVLMGFLIILGFSKQFSLAQVALYGIGAYLAANLTAKLGLGFLPTLLASGLLAGVVGGLIAIPGARFVGPWLALVTFAFAEIVRILMARLKPLTGGSVGFRNIPRPEIFDYRFSGEADYYFLFLALALFAYLVTLRFRFSPYGRIALAIGDNPDIAASLGVNVFRHRIFAFFLGSMLAGMAGAAFAVYATYISPESFGLAHTIQYLTMLVVGGLESIPGALLAVVFFTFSHNQLMAWHPWDLILDGVIILLFMNLMPRGIGGLLTDLGLRWAAWRASAGSRVP
ncbi:MAG: branched-chain amino acid ABC transporter permease [Rhodospirillales bacterium]|nr:branched-chain amino acid ABC transporter permease [Rhodospirillales bacterium]